MAEVRLIDANALKEKAREMELCSAVTVWDIDEAPTISPDSLRPKGRWNGTNCPFCKGSYMDYADADSYPAIGEPKPNFCPNCGAKMEA